MTIATEDNTPMTIKEAAKVLGISELRTRELIWSGDLKAINVSRPGSTRRHLRVTPHAIDEYHCDEEERALVQELHAGKITHLEFMRRRPAPAYMMRSAQAHLEDVKKRVARKERREAKRKAKQKLKST